jgi:uncharacterized SAM-binding protein YcdF (DUF218 family)
LLVLAAMAALVWVCRTALLTGAATFLIENDGPQKTQAAEVLGGDDSGARILKAAQLAQAGYVPYVIVDGPKKLVGHESDILIQYVVQKGYPPSLFRALPLPGGMNSTREETAFAGKYLKEHGIQKILLVTSNYHTRRAAYLMRKQNPGLQVVAIAAADPNFDPNIWWKSREGKKVFLLEWIKTIATYFGI